MPFEELSDLILRHFVPKDDQIESEFLQLEECFIDFVFGLRYVELAGENEDVPLFVVLVDA